MHRNDMLRIVLWYAVIASAYILFSDKLLYGLAPTLAALEWVSIAKGLGFVATTALTLWLLMCRLQNAESARYQALVENHQAIMLLIDPADGAIIDCNLSAAEFYGYPAATLRGLNITDINHLAVGDISRITRHALAHHDDLLHLRHWLADGTSREVLVQTGPVMHRGKQLLLSIIRDQTQDLRNQQEVERLLSLHAMLSRSNQLLVKATSRAELFEQLCRIAVEIGHFRFAWISLLDARREMQPVARAGQLPVVLASDQEPTPLAWRQAIESGEFGSSIAIALRSGESVIGSFELFAGEPDFFGARELETLYAMIDDVAFGLDNLARVATLAVASDIVESSSVVLFRVDDVESWHVSFVTENVNKWGYSAASLLSGLVKYDEVVYPEDLGRVLREVANYLRSGQREFTQIYRIVTATGEQRWVEDKSSARYDDAGRLLYLQGALTDITDSYRMQLALLESELRYRTMINSSPDILFINTGGTISFMNPNGLRLLGAKSPEEIIGRPVLTILHPECHALVHQRVEEAKSHPGTSMPVIVLPFTSLDGRLLRVEVSACSFYNNSSLDILVFGHDITYREEAEHTIRDYVARLERAMLATTAAVSQIVELRDPYTAGHERRVGEMAAAIAAELGLDDNVQRGLRVAGALHDVGKVVVPTEILTKPGRLTAVEYELVKQHAEQGYRILSQVDYPWPVAEVAYQHHERIDGQGYPRGLKGDEILLEARIVAVADVVESMSSHRPYRPSRGVEEALTEIENGRGTRYDPAIVDACLRLFREKHYSVPQ